MYDFSHGYGTSTLSCVRPTRSMVRSAQILSLSAHANTEIGRKRNAIVRRYFFINELLVRPERIGIIVKS